MINIIFLRNHAVYACSVLYFCLLRMIKNISLSLAQESVLVSRSAGIEVSGTGAHITLLCNVWLRKYVN